MILYMYIAPGRKQTAPRGKSFDVNRNVLSLYLFVASFKKMSLKSKKISNDQELIQSDPTSCPQNQKGNN